MKRLFETENVGGGGTPQLGISKDAKTRSRKASIVNNTFLPRGRDAEKLSSLKRTYCPNVLTSYRLKKCAFTLAEVLVTLGIIGVVSAMTVPTLMQNHQRKVYVTQLHKVYSEMSQALSLYITEKNAVNLKESRFNTIDGLNDFISSHLKVVKDCGSAVKDCFASQYGYINSSTVISGGNPTCNRVITLASGAILCIDVENGSGSINEDDEQEGSTTNLKGAVATIEVDVNGTSGPNIFGRDYFVMFIDNDGTIKDYAFEEYGLVTDSSKGSYTGAFGKIMDDGWQMNY